MNPLGFAICALGYFLGAIPFGVIWAKQAGIDIMKVGSGNIGATNVMRVLGKKAGLSVFALDVLKGLLPPLIARGLGLDQNWQFFAGIAAVLGHTASPFLGFKGGKGIATSLGALLGSVPLTALSSFGVFLVLLAAFRWVSLGSVAAALVVPVFAYVFHESPTVQIALIPVCLLIIVKHRKNIGRLLQGTEPKFVFGQQKVSAQSSDEDRQDLPQQPS